MTSQRLASLAQRRQRTSDSSLGIHGRGHVPMCSSTPEQIALIYALAREDPTGWRRAGLGHFTPDLTAREWEALAAQMTTGQFRKLRRQIRASR
jgi:hypothetical protein